MKKLKEQIKSFNPTCEQEERDKEYFLKFNNSKSKVISFELMYVFVCTISLSSSSFGNIFLTLFINIDFLNPFPSLSVPVP